VRTKAISTIAGALALLGFAAAQAQAPEQNYPNRAVKLVVPFAPGGFPDVVARIFAQQLQTDLGQPFVVENKPGAGGAIAGEYVANSEPDGYTLLVADPQQWIIPFVYKNLRYDPIKGMAPVATIASTGIFFVVNKKLPVSNFAEFLTLVKANPGKFNYGSPGPGSLHQLTMETLKANAGIDVVHVAFKGGSQVVAALLAGDVEMGFQAMPSLTAYLGDGTLKVIAAADKKRSEIAPDVPTFAELGLPGVEFPGPLGILAPKGTPPQIIAKLAEQLKTISDMPEIRQRLRSLAIEPGGLGPSDFARIIDESAAKYEQAVKLIGLQPM
jgi:tripartite-type tricarboxylate transporter receptor subunit TctC